MNLFVVAASHKSPVSVARLEAGLRDAAAPIPALESEAVRGWASPSERVGGASICHGSAAGLRRYRFEEPDEIVLFDGLPVMSDGSSQMGAKALVQRLARTQDGIEGMFAVARLDLAGDLVEVYTDPLGNLAVYEMVSDDGAHYVSNSLAALAAIAGSCQMDSVGVSSFLTLGWYVDGRTALAGVKLVGGGTRLSLVPGRPPARHRYFEPALLANGSLETPSLKTVHSNLVGQLRSAASYGSSLRLGLTAGQDSRACLALALAAGVDVDLYTEGAVGDVDVDVARAVARTAGLAHEVIPRQSTSPLGTSSVVQQFIGQGDAASSFSQFHDQFAQLTPNEHLSIKLLGLGGEVTRSNRQPIRGFLVSGPVGGLRGVQLKCLAGKISDSGGLVRSRARSLTFEELVSWLDARQAEGWGSRMLAETLYVFDAMIRYHQGSQRRTAGTSDVFAPLSSRHLITYTFGMSPFRRYEPGTLEDLIRATNPELLRVPTRPPYHRTRSSVAPFSATKALAQLAWSRHGRGLSKAGSAGEDDQSPADVAKAHIERIESAGDSPLFSLVDRDALIEACRGQRSMSAGAFRALTLVWWFQTVAGASAQASASRALNNA